LPQNFVPAGFFVLHFGQVISVPVASACGMRGAPQLPQNFMLAGFSVLHFGQIIFAGGAKLAPQFPQNFVPTGFLEPQLWQITTC
jgi:hypothetical protein